MPSLPGHWLALAAIAAQAVLPLAHTSHQQSLTSAAPCAGSKPPATYSHVITIMEENHAYSSIIGSSQAPYENSLAKVCGLAKDYYAESYPSLPNYIALTSGGIPSSVAHRDCLPTGSCTTGSASIFSQVGSSWKVYAESMPSNCYRNNTSNGLYLPRHTAAPYYTQENSACAKQQVPLGTATSGAFQCSARIAVTIPTTRSAHQATRWATTAGGSSSPVLSSTPERTNTRTHAVRAVSPSARGTLRLTGRPRSAQATWRPTADTRRCSPRKPRKPGPSQTPKELDAPTVPEPHGNTTH